MKSLLNRPVLLLLLVNLFGLGVLELLARGLAYNGIIHLRYYPTTSERTLADIDPHFGIWRYKNRQSRHLGICFDVEYNTNSFGMRDKEVELSSVKQKRLVVLGDSYVEGFGVETSDRFTEVVESKTGVESLNFGVSGDFSSTQEYLLYRELASKFDHSAVLLFLLPENDFKDNDPTLFEASRYRPYLRKKPESSEYEVYYTVDFEKRSQESKMSTFRSFRRRLYNKVFLFNAIRQLGGMLETSDLKAEIKGSFTDYEKNYYFDYEAEELEILTWGYRKIAELVAPKPLYIFIIPREEDFRRAERETVKAPLPEDLKKLSLQHDNIIIFDLLPYFQDYMKTHNINRKDITLPCDGHWSALGHSIAASAVEHELSKRAHL